MNICYTVAYSRTRRVLTGVSLMLVVTLLLGPALPETAGAQQARAEGWRDTGIRLPPLQHFMCIDAKHPNNAILATDAGTVAYDWRKGRSRFLNNLKSDYCRPDGWLYAFDGTYSDSPLFRFSVSTPGAQAAEHMPVAVGPDGVIYDFSEPHPYAPTSPYFVVWASTDDGVTWQQQIHKFTGRVESYSAASADARVVYVLVRNEIEPQPGKLHYTIYATTDAGQSWDKRSEGETDASYYGVDLYRTLSTGETPNVPVDQVEINTSCGVGSYCFSVARYSSIDGGRSFKGPDLSGLDENYREQTIRTHDGILRLAQYFSGNGRSKTLAKEELTLSTDQGNTWQNLSGFPKLVDGATIHDGDGRDNLFSVPDAPDNVFVQRNSLDAGASLLLYSPDGGHTWQKFERKTESSYYVPPYMPLTILGVQLSESGDPRLLTPIPRSTNTSEPPAYPQYTLYALDLPDAGKSLSVPVVPNGAPDDIYFTQTGHNLSGAFKEYWEAHGGLAQQGYPLTETFREVNDTDGKVYTTQYFERAVFELHPENLASNNVLLSLLGVFAYRDRYGVEGAPSQKASMDSPYSFPETGHTLGGKFRAYWEAHGGLAQQGYPISDEFQEKSELDGKVYTVQYFERVVFELHPENAGTPFEVLLSQLGMEHLKGKYESVSPSK